jgi:hypothetical protein
MSNFKYTPIVLFFKKENGGFDCYFKTAVWLLIFSFVHENFAAKQRFFYLPLLRIFR